MKNLITILTVCSRPEYLSKIYDSIINQNYDNFKWIISFDFDEFPNVETKIIEDKRVEQVLYKNKEWDITNYGALNNILDNHISDPTWICIIDDDNIMYPNYLNTINSKLTKKLKFVLYNQLYFDNTIRFIGRTKDIAEGHIDTAQVCFYSTLAKNVRFVSKYTADGIFYKELFNKIN